MERGSFIRYQIANMHTNTLHPLNSRRYVEYLSTISAQQIHRQIVYLFVFIYQKTLWWPKQRCMTSFCFLFG